MYVTTVSPNCRRTVSPWDYCIHISIIITLLTFQVKNNVVVLQATAVRQQPCRPVGSLQRSLSPGNRRRSQLHSKRCTYHSNINKVSSRHVEDDLKRLKRHLNVFLTLRVGICKHRELLYEWLPTKDKEQQEAVEEAVVCHQEQSPVHLRCQRGNTVCSAGTRIGLGFSFGDYISLYRPNVIQVGLFI